MIRTSRAPTNPDQAAIIQAAKAALSRPFPDGKTELQKAEEYYLGKPTPTVSYSFTRYGEPPVRLAVDSIFKRKCVFCESNYSAVKAGNVEHYRPKGGVTERNPSFPGYWWLASDWDNLLSSCLACNQLRKHTHYAASIPLVNYDQQMNQGPTRTSGKANSFPVRGNNWVTSPRGNLTNEDPLLINPCDRNPEHHLEWGFDWDKNYPFWEALPLIGFLKPKVVNGSPDPYGEISIGTYGLNRAGLMRDREARLRLLQGICRRGFGRIYQAAVNDRASRLKDTFNDLASFAESDQPYAGMAISLTKLFPGELQKYL